MSSLVIKIIALITMFIDHVGYLLFPEQILFRLIGRIAMPLFAFQFAVGLKHTSDYKKKMIKTFIFAILVQIPYTLFAIMAGDTPNLNIIFTFLLASFVIFTINSIPIRDEETKKLNKSNLLSVIFISLLICIFPLVIFNTDYDIYGILLTVGFYYFMDKKRIIILLYPFLAITYACLFPSTTTFLGMFATIVDVPIIYAFNGKKGYKNGNFFYIAYFVHFLVLCLIKYFLPT